MKSNLYKRGLVILGATGLLVGVFAFLFSDFEFGSVAPSVGPVPVSAAVEASAGVAFDSGDAESTFVSVAGRLPGASSGVAGALDRYQDADVLDERLGHVSSAGLFGRVRLVKTSSKHPYHRLEEVLQRQADGSDLLLLQHAMAADHIVVVLDPGVLRDDAAAMLAGGGLDILEETGIPGGYLVGMAGAVDLATVPDLLVRVGGVSGAVRSEPNYVYWHAAVQPDDAHYAEQWGLDRINMPEVWGVGARTSDVVVAVFDTGSTLTHQDLYENRWVYDGEIAGNGIDDDGNGYIDDRHGWHFYYKNADPTDLNGHGTHVHGIIGAAGNNGVGISGVAWQVRTLPIAFMGAEGNGFSADAASGLYYIQDLISRGVPIRVANHSWGGGAYSEELYQAFKHVSADVLHVAAAGNTSFGGKNTDFTPFYPAGFNVSNLVSVANSTSADQLHYESNYGASSVDLAAPGGSILSTVNSGVYGIKTGTSMAAPHVSGVMALLMRAYPQLPRERLQAALLEGVDPAPAFQGVVATGGILDAWGAFLAIGPLLGHEPLGNVDAWQAEYGVSVSVTPGVGLLDGNGVRLIWDVSADFGSAQVVPLAAGSDGIFSGAIPAQSRGSRIYYYLAATSVDGKAVTHPEGAPFEKHMFDVTYPVDVHVQATPGLYGSVFPSYGKNSYPFGSVITFRADEATSPVDGMRWRNIGWDGAGSVPLSGMTNTFTTTLRETSYLVWRWQQQFTMQESGLPSGAMVPVSRWVDGGKAASTSEAAAEIVLEGITYRFVGWFVDGQRQPLAGSRAMNPASGIQVAGPVEAVAHYVRADEDSDLDGLPDWWEWYWFGHLDFTALDDPDGDGASNESEYQDQSDPADSASVPMGPSIQLTDVLADVSEPAPWTILADVRDASGLAVVLLYWREAGGGDWQTVRMETVASEPDLYSGAILGPDRSGIEIEYKLFAEDAWGYASTTDVYRFRVDYPILAFGAVDLGESLLVGESRFIRVAVTNLGTAAWDWRAVFGYEEGVMEPIVAGWSSGGASNQWHVSDREFASAPYAWFCGDAGGGVYASEMDASLYTPPVTLGADAHLRFVHWAEMERDDRDGYAGYYWDGAVVELSTDGGATYFAIEPEGGYPYRITPNDASPFEAHRPCFGGVTGGWQQAEFDLSAYAGATVQARFRFGTDRWVASRGWFIDDIVFDWASDWLTAVGGQGQLAPGASGWLEWQIDASGLSTGHYETIWTVVGNAPGQSVVTGTVVLEVRAIPTAVLQMQQASEPLDPETFVLRWHSETGRVYSLLQGSNLLDGSWMGVPGLTNLPGGGEMSYTGRIDRVSRQFYRVLEQ